MNQVTPRKSDEYKYNVHLWRQLTKVQQKWIHKSLYRKTPVKLKEIPMRTYISLIKVGYMMAPIGDKNIVLLTWRGGVVARAASMAKGRAASRAA